MKIKVAVGLSGGIDSSFAAYFLKNEGFEVTGFTLKFYPEENRCCDLDSLYQAKRLCDKLNIAHYVLDVKELFQKEIIDYFTKSYLYGLTPNPCIFCNRLIKFGYFLEKVKSLGIGHLATGHYARLIKENGNFLLQTAKDKKKSQEYFLSLLNKEILKSLILPLGQFTKAEVKEIVRKEKVLFKERKESQDICFAKDKSYAQIIEESIAHKKDYQGDICYVSGKVLGQHKGIYYFTIGQREGLGIGWKEPLYVINIDAENKKVIIGERKYLSQNTFTTGSLNWFVDPFKYKPLKVKVRYNSLLHECTLTPKGNKMAVLLKDEVEAITPGQIAAFYYGDILIGGGIIEKEQVKVEKDRK